MKGVHVTGMRDCIREVPELERCQYHRGVYQ